MIEYEQELDAKIKELQAEMERLDAKRPQTADDRIRMHVIDCELDGWSGAMELYEDIRADMPNAVRCQLARDRGDLDQYVIGVNLVNIWPQSSEDDGVCWEYDGNKPGWSADLPLPLDILQPGEGPIDVWLSLRRVESVDADAEGGKR